MTVLMPPQSGNGGGGWGTGSGVAYDQGWFHSGKPFLNPVMGRTPALGARRMWGGGLNSGAQRSGQGLCSHLLVQNSLGVTDRSRNAVFLQELLPSPNHNWPHNPQPPIGPFTRKPVCWSPGRALCPSCSLPSPSAGLRVPRAAGHLAWSSLLFCPPWAGVWGRVQAGPSMAWHQGVLWGC